MKVLDYVLTVSPLEYGKLIMVRMGQIIIIIVIIVL